MLFEEVRVVHSLRLRTKEESSVGLVEEHVRQLGML